MQRVAFPEPACMNRRRRSGVTLSLKTQRKHLSSNLRPLSSPLLFFLHSCQEISPSASERSSARQGSARVLSAMSRHVLGCVFLQTEAPSHCGSQGGGYTDADLWMQHRLRVSFLSICQGKRSQTFACSTDCFSLTHCLYSDLSFCL